MTRPCDKCIDKDATIRIDDNFYCEDCDADENNEDEKDEDNNST